MAGDNFRAPKMSYAPRTFELWEHIASFTVVDAPFEMVRPIAEGVIRARQGPSGEIVGERRPPLLAFAHMQADADAGRETLGASLIVEGVLIFSPIEAPELTVVEHPLDYVSSAGFPEDLSRLMPETRLFTFDSELESKARQLHGISVRLGKTIERRVHLARGHEKAGWYWEEHGPPQPFEDKARLAKTRNWDRLDRRLVFDYASRLGLDPNLSLFGRKFAASVYIFPLAHDMPEAAAFGAKISPDAAFDAGVTPSIGLETKDADFPETAGLMAAMMRWERQMDQARVKAWRSDKNAKTPAGRERAQRRVVETVRDVVDDMQRFGISENNIALYIGQLRPPMRALGRKTKAFAEFKILSRNPLWAFWRR